MKLYESHQEKTCLLHVKTKTQISYMVNTELLSALVFTTYRYIVQPLCFLNRNFKPIAIFCGCTARFVSDLVETLKTGFLMTSLI